MQAITTKYHGPTDFRGSRVTARCVDGRSTLPWDHSKDATGNHDAAAVALCLKLGWRDRRLIAGVMATGERVYCIMPKDPSQILRVG